MNGGESRTNSLIPIENDDNFYNIYHHKPPSNQKLNILLKKSYDFEKNNSFNSFKKDEAVSVKSKKRNLIKLNLNLKREHKLPSLLKRIPFSGYKKEKIMKREKMEIKKQYFTINDIVLDETEIIKKKAINMNIPMKKYIKIYKKNQINRNLINRKYERDLIEFKIYSHNMNDMIAEQMVLEFFKRINKIKSLNFNDLLLNYILSCDGKTNIYENEFSTINDINDGENEENNENESEEIEHNLIIHNVFFEWIISKVVKNYTKDLKTKIKNITNKSIKNIFINEVENLSKIFFSKSFEKINIINNYDNINNKSINYEISKTEDNSINNEEINKKKIKSELIDRIIEKVAKKNPNSLDKINRFNNYPKSVSIRKKKIRDMKMNLKKNFNDGNTMKKICNDIPELLLKNEKEVKSELNKYQNNAQYISINNRKFIIRNKRDKLKNISFETNPDATLNEKNKNKIGLKSYMEGIDNPKLRLYEQYYKYEGVDQLSDENLTFTPIKRVSKKFSVSIENKKNKDNSEFLKYDFKNPNNSIANKKRLPENIINIKRKSRMKIENITNDKDFNEIKNLESNEATITEHMKKEKLKENIKTNTDNEGEIENNNKNEKRKNKINKVQQERNSYTNEDKIFENINKPNEELKESINNKEEEEEIENEEEEFEEDTENKEEQEESEEENEQIESGNEKEKSYLKIEGKIENKEEKGIEKENGKELDDKENIELKENNIEKILIKKNKKVNEMENILIDKNKKEIETENILIDKDKKENQNIESKKIFELKLKENRNNKEKTNIKKITNIKEKNKEKLPIKNNKKWKEKINKHANNEEIIHKDYKEEKILNGDLDNINVSNVDNFKDKIVNDSTINDESNFKEENYKKSYYNKKEKTEKIEKEKVIEEKELKDEIEKEEIERKNLEIEE